jgi:exonuclease III
VDKGPKRKKIDMRFDTWNVRRLYRAGSIMTVAKEALKFKLYLVGVQEFRWERGDTEPAGQYTFFCGKGNENLESGIGFFVHKGLISAVKKVEFVSDRMSYIILKGRRCDVILLNIYFPTEDKINDMKDSFYAEPDCVFDIFPKYHVKILLGDFNAKVDKEGIFTPTIGNDSLQEIGNDN